MLELMVDDGSTAAAADAAAAAARVYLSLRTRVHKLFWSPVVSIVMQDSCSDFNCKWPEPVYVPKMPTLL